MLGHVHQPVPRVARAAVSATAEARRLSARLATDVSGGDYRAFSDVLRTPAEIPWGQTSILRAVPIHARAT